MIYTRIEPNSILASVGGAGYARLSFHPLGQPLVPQIHALFLNLLLFYNLEVNPQVVPKIFSLLHYLKMYVHVYTYVTLTFLLYMLY